MHDVTINPQIEAEWARLRYPFDQYQRYRDVKEVVDLIQTVRPDRPVRILDVGGSPTAWKFLPEYSVTTANLSVSEAISLQTDGTRLACKDESFDVVITVDTLEHLPEALRPAFLDELMRVAADYIIITGPFANDYNEFGEATLNEYIVNAFHAHHQFLQEHLQNGLPSLELCRHQLTAAGAENIAVPSGYMVYWLPLMVIKVSLMQVWQGADYSADLDALYNSQRYWADHRLPSYRHLVVAAKHSADNPLLVAVEQHFSQNTPDYAPDFSSIVAMWQAITWQRALKARDMEIAVLRKQVEGYKSGRVMRLLTALHNLLSVFRK
ncbi:MAG: class I SAM-dependent methyltransferase [Chloroflexi bacterium]|nr:MAG: class I SAM-dependent methyltransferase [Chloroflexota bacterium]